MSPNYRGLEQFRVGIGLGIVAIVAVGLRFLARWLTRLPYGADDAWIIVSLVFMLAMLINDVYNDYAGGMGKHYTTLSASEAHIFFKSFFAGEVLYYATITPTKISILLLYRRIFSTRRFHLVTVLVGIICVAWCIAGLFVSFFQCKPIHAAWNPSMDPQRPDRCINLQAFYLGITISNMLTDIIILCLPIGMIWGLRLPPKQKLTLSGIFLLGGLVCIASIMRIITLAEVTNYSDATWSLLQCAIWTSAEPELAITCACLPTLRPLFPKHITVPRLSTYLSKGSQNSVTQRSWYSSRTSDVKRSIRNSLSTDVCGDKRMSYKKLNERQGVSYVSRIEGGARPEDWVELANNHAEAPKMGITVRNDVTIA